MGRQWSLEVKIIIIFNWNLPIGLKHGIENLSNLYKEKLQKKKKSKQTYWFILLFSNFLHFLI